MQRGSSGPRGVMTSAGSKRALFTSGRVKKLNWFFLIAILGFTCWYTAGFQIRRTAWDLGSQFDYGMNYERSVAVAEHLAYPPRSVGFLYPLPSVIMRLGLGRLGIELSAMAWMALLIAATLACLEASLYLLGLANHPWKYGCALLTLLSVEYFVEYDLHALNGTLIYLAVLFAALVFSYKSKPAWAGLCLAASIALKLYSAVFLPYFLIRRQYRVCLSTTLWLVVFFAVLPAAAFGIDNALIVTRNWWHTVLEVSSSMTFPWDYVAYLMSTHRMFLTLLTEKGGKGIYNLMSLGEKEVFAITRLVQLGWLVLVAYYFWSRARDPIEAPAGTTLMMDAGVLTLAVLPLSPALQAPHGVVMLIPASLLVALSLDSTRPPGHRWCSLAILAVCWFEMQFGPKGDLRTLSMNLVIIFFMCGLIFLRMSRYSSVHAAPVRRWTGASKVERERIHPMRKGTNPMNRNGGKGFGSILSLPGGWGWIPVLCLLLAGACVGSAEHERLMREKYPTYPDTVKRAIDRGYLLRDMDPEQVLLAMGDPVCKKTIQFNGRPVEVWLFPPAGRDPCVSPDFRVYFEKGIVTGWEDFRTKPSGSVEPTVNRGDNPYATQQY